MDKKSKEIQMSGEQGKKQEKLTYEQLEQMAGNLNKQCQQFYNQLQEANRVISEFNEIGMLLDILGKSEHFSEAFVARCSKKIEDIVTRALDAAEKQEKNNNEN